MLDDQVPLRIVHGIVEIRNGNLDSPVQLVVELNMPMNSDWAHMTRALDERIATVLPRNYRS